MLTVPAVHFALRSSEPDRAACGKRQARRMYVGETVQDEISRRLQGQRVTTCRPCRRAMRWTVATFASVPARNTLAASRW